MISLDKIDNSTEGLSLKKSIKNFENAMISLEKDSSFSFLNHTARVAVAIDFSGSMNKLYKDGSVQRILNRLMPLALKFDDDGELDVWLFDHEFRTLPSMNIDNFQDYVKKEILDNKWHMGRTCYAPVLEDIMKKYFSLGLKKESVFLVFITDGGNSDKNATDKIIRDSSKKDIFIKFIGMGKEEFPYLEKLDDLAGREVDNTAFSKIEDFEKVSDETLYKILLDQYPEWVEEKGRR